MAATTNYNVKLAGSAIDPQPSRVVVTPPKAVRHQAINGGFISFQRYKGWQFELIWGSGEIIDDDPLVELATIKAAMSDPTISLAFTWFDGQEYTFDVLWDEEVAAAFRWGSLAERFSIMLYEADLELSS